MSTGDVDKLRAHITAALEWVQEQGEPVIEDHLGRCRKRYEAIK